MDYEDDVSRELIKCVVVGDTGVGKTRLICAKACGQKPSLEQLINVHVPTVWAIDQYRICRDVLERSFEIVDGISIALRIWDTFGDHHNDRCFAYGRSDVVLLCFSVANTRSLEHAKTVWYPEIRRQRPNVPVLLVACKNDLRYLCIQPDFQRMLAERRPSPLKPVNTDDIVSPEQGRAAAKEIGAFYYETSVLTRFGVEETFQNAVRAALCRRRQGRLWSGHFQLVKFPQLQAPYLPPKPAVPVIRFSPSSYVEQMAGLVRDQSAATSSGNSLGDTNSDRETYYDCVLRVRDQVFMAHKLLLASSSILFRRLFVCETINCRTCSIDEYDSTEERDPLETRSADTRRDSLLDEKTDRDLLLADNDDEDDTSDVFACLPVVLHHRPSNGGAVAGSSSNASSTKDAGANGKQLRRRKSADFTSTVRQNIVSNKNRHATIAGFLTSNHSSSSFNQLRSTTVHAKSATTAIQSGLTNGTVVMSISEDYRYRNKSVIIPVTIVALNNELSPNAVKLALNYTYCGILDPRFSVDSSSSGLHRHPSNKAPSSSTALSKADITELLKVADAFEIDSLRAALMEKLVQSPAPPSLGSTIYADAQFLTERSANLIELGLECGLFSDVKFVLDDGVVRAQKFLLCARCDVMRAMFSSTFRESCLSQVTLPGVNVEALRLFLAYLFVDSIASYAGRSCHLSDLMEALELANRMCISRLITVLEGEIVNELERLDEAQELNFDEVLQMLEPAQMCNAQQLVSWCLHYLCCNYSRLCDQCGKLLKSLLPSNQDYLVKHRWPPLWYLKEYDWHEKIVREGQRAAELAANKLLKRTRTNSGCLCFSSRASALMQHNSI